MSYILFTAVALFFLNLYASSTLRSITFQSKRDYLSDKAQTVSAASEEETASMHEIADASRKLAEQAQSLQNSIAVFKI